MTCTRLLALRRVGTTAATMVSLCQLRAFSTLLIAGTAAVSEQKKREMRNMSPSRAPRQCHSERRANPGAPPLRASRDDNAPTPWSAGTAQPVWANQGRHGRRRDSCMQGSLPPTRSRKRRSQSAGRARCGPRTRMLMLALMGEQNADGPADRRRDHAAAALKTPAAGPLKIAAPRVEPLNSVSSALGGQGGPIRTAG
jgi:hypothetical protein